MTEVSRAKKNKERVQTEGLKRLYADGLGLLFPSLVLCL